jgi:hypothetical protein
LPIVDAAAFLCANVFFLCLFLQRVQLALDLLSGGSVAKNAHSLTVEVSAGWGGVYVRSCTINGISVPAAIVPHDVLQVTPFI